MFKMRVESNFDRIFLYRKSFARAREINGTFFALDLTIFFIYIASVLCPFNATNNITNLFRAILSTEVISHSQPLPGYQSN